jgi:hypothetical protein
VFVEAGHIDTLTVGHEAHRIEAADAGALAATAAPPGQELRFEAARDGPHFAALAFRTKEEVQIRSIHIRIRHYGPASEAA